MFQCEMNAAAERRASAFPQLQVAGGLDEAAFDRLERCLEVGRADPRYFRALNYETVPADLDHRLANLIIGLAGLEGGPMIAVEVLENRTRLVGKGPDEELAEEYVRAARQVLAGIGFDEAGQERNYALSQLTKRCAAGVEGLPTARGMLANLKTAARAGRHQMWEFEDVLDALFEVQPRASLEAFLVDGDEDALRFDVFGWLRANPIRHIPDEVLLAWVEEDVSDRLPRAARSVRVFDRTQGGCAVTTTFAELWRRRRDEGGLLEILADRLMPRSWGGSLADILEARWSAVEALLLGNPDLQREPWLEEQRDILARRCAREREGERRTDERFE